jgi:hypothetical protein
MSVLLLHVPRRHPLMAEVPKVVASEETDEGMLVVLEMTDSSPCLCGLLTQQLKFKAYVGAPCTACIHSRSLQASVH